jgi:hypothetical protein
MAALLLLGCLLSGEEDEDEDTKEDDDENDEDDKEAPRCRCCCCCFRCCLSTGVTKQAKEEAVGPGVV